MLNVFLILLLFIYNFPSSEQIIQGNVVLIEEFPYIVSIRYSDNHVCSGAILDEKTILTSAQCIFDLKDKPALISIRAGSSEHANGQQIKVNKKPIHPKTYDRIFHENDIGIVKLASSLTWNDKIKPIDLPDKDYVVPYDTAASFVGWGVANANDVEVSPILRQTIATTISYMNCTVQYGSNMIYAKSMLCAQAKQQEFCRGDIGGPLVHDDKLIGVASWIDNCDKSTHPGVYTNVVKFLDWIQSNLEKRAFNKMTPNLEEL